VAVTLSRVLCVALAGDTPPTEFRVFSRGVNATTKGEFLFDEKSAKSVMAAYREHGEEVMIDLEHLSLESTERSQNFDPDARGWCRLELRNGELWAVAVRWTPDGEARLRERRQRFISPAFDVDQENRITRLCNIALTALPATHGLVPLIAANARNLKMAIDLGKLAAALGVTEDPATDAGKAALKSGLQAALKEVGGDSEPSNPVDYVEAMTTRREVIRLTGAKDALEAVDRVSAWRTLAVEHEAAAKKLAEDRANLEKTERAGLYKKLVELGSETPHTSGLAAGKPAKHLEGMTLVELRDRVASLSARGSETGGQKPKTEQQAVSEDGSQTIDIGGKPVLLSARELKMCADAKPPVDPKVYAANKLAKKRA
jgi:phage I-like protein